MIRFQALGIRFCLPLLSLLAPLLCIRLGMRMNTFALLLGVGLHEFAHILAAKCLRVNILEVRLTPFGGSAKMENPYALSASQLFVTALAGPLANLLCATAFAAMVHWGILHPSDVAGHISFNLTLFFFNLLPALPLDGGRMLYCLLQGFIGCAKALRFGIFAGYILSATLLILTASACVRSGRLNLCLILVSVFIFASARDERDAQLEVQSKLLLEHPSGPQPVRIYQLDRNTRAYEALSLLRPREIAWFLLTENGEPRGMLSGRSLAAYLRSGGRPDASLCTLSTYPLAPTGICDIQKSRTPQ